MVRVQFTTVLKNFFPDLKEEVIEASDISELISKINYKYPGIRDYLLDETGKIRGHVSLFINNELLPRHSLGQPLKPRNTVLIYQAISGG